MTGAWGGEPADLAGAVAAALDERQQAGASAVRSPLAGGVEQLARLTARRHATSTTSSTLTTSVTPSTRSRMIRSMPAFSVCVDAGQPTHAPMSVTVTMPRLLVDVAEHDVAAVGLQGRADHVDGLQDLVTHHVDLGPFKQARPYHWRVMVNVVLVGGIPLLAHQGGWDEILLVAVPIAVVGALLWVARRRVDRTSADADDVGADRA